MTTTITAPVMGFNGKAYYNSGTHGSPTWSLVANLGDIKVTDERTTKDIEVRSQNGFAVTVAGLRKLSFEWSSVYDPADAAQTALRTLYWANTNVEMQFLDGLVSGGSYTNGPNGVEGTFQISKFPRQEELNNAMMVDMGVVLTYGDGTNWLVPTRIGSV